VGLLPRPTSKVRRLLGSPESYKAGKVILIAATGAVVGLKFQTQALHSWAILVWFITALATILEVIGAAMSISRAAQRESVHELAGCLETLLAIINPPGSADYDRGLRATLHRAERSGGFVQVLDYVGDSRAGHTAGRKFRADAGIAARVLQDREAYAGSRSVANHQTYVGELQQIWGYTPEEAEARDKSAMSWMAVPLENQGEIGGVLFLDSTQPDFFYVVARQRDVVASAVGIAKFAVRRYTSDS